MFGRGLTCLNSCRVCTLAFFPRWHLPWRSRMPFSPALASLQALFALDAPSRRNDLCPWCPAVCSVSRALQLPQRCLCMYCTSRSFIMVRCSFSTGILTNHTKRRGSKQFFARRSKSGQASRWPPGLHRQSPRLWHGRERIERQLPVRHLRRRIDGWIGVGLFSNGSLAQSRARRGVA